MYLYRLQAGPFQQNRRLLLLRRLSAAISRGGGLSWGNYQTLELSEGLADEVRILPEYPIKMVRARSRVGYLPERYAYCHHANLSFVQDKVYVSYLRGMPLLGIAEQNLDVQESVLRTYLLASSSPTLAGRGWMGDRTRS